jgi:CDP-glucose 4,6-dehydratase
MFQNKFRNKKVLITGHTGFKGSWLTAWLLQCGAKIVGISKDIPTKPSMFESLNLKNKISHYFLDIRELEPLRKIILNESPDFIFHLAAQAIVSISKENPSETISTNALGTMNLLEVLRSYGKNCSVVFITSDKCYDNLEWVWGYKETDKLGGKDIYSGSKAAAEVILNSYLQTFFTNDHPVKIGIGRAGNVLGGGDWAKDRIVVDSVKAWGNKKPVFIRAPRSTRPWQHVLEPLSGYLHLAVQLNEKKNLHSQAFNFGPRADQNKSVIDLIIDISKGWDLPKNNIFNVDKNNIFNESKLLKLNCDKALFHLEWESNLEYKETVNFVSEWYWEYYQSNSKNILEKTISQIERYCELAIKRKRIWTRN